MPNARSLWTTNSKWSPCPSHTLVIPFISLSHIITLYWKEGSAPRIPLLGNRDLKAKGGKHPQTIHIYIYEYPGVVAAGKGEILASLWLMTFVCFETSNLHICSFALFFSSRHMDLLCVKLWSSLQATKTRRKLWLARGKHQAFAHFDTELEDDSDTFGRLHLVGCTWIYVWWSVFGIFDAQASAGNLQVGSMAGGA